MAQLLMPKATAVWLVDNTALTFDQIADFCELHILEVQAIADGEVAPGMQGLDPIGNGQLLQEELDRCTADSTGRLEIAKPTVPMPKVRPKGARYTPISKRQDRPDAIAWLLRSYPELSDAQLCRLIGTTKPTINSVRDRTHRNIANIKPQSPVYLGLCSAADLEKMVAVARARTGTTRSAVEPLPPTGEPASDPASTHGSMPASLPPAAMPAPVAVAAPEPEVVESPFAAAAALFSKPAEAEPEAAAPADEVSEEASNSATLPAGEQPTAAPPPTAVPANDGVDGSDTKSE